MVLLLGSLLTSGAVFAMSRTPSYRLAVIRGRGARPGDGGGQRGDHQADADRLFPAQTAGPGPVPGPRLRRDSRSAGAGAGRRAPRSPRLSPAVALIAGVCLVPAILCAVPAFRSAAIRQTSAAGSMAALFHGDKLQALLLAGLVLFFYAPLEALLSIWVTAHATDVGRRERRAALALTGFWAHCSARGC